MIHTCSSLVRVLVIALFTQIVGSLTLVVAEITPMKVTLRLTLGVPVDLPAIPEQWINEYFPGHSVTWDSDFDRDGMADYMEYYAGTFPDDGSSMLKINGLVVSGDTVTITWSSSPSADPARREYVVYRADGNALSTLTNPDLTLQDYENLAENPTSSGITFVGREEAAAGVAETSIEHQDVGLESGQFYRVFLVRPLPE